MSDSTSSRVLARNTNQALGIGQYAIDFLREGKPSQAVLDRTTLFHTVAVLCGASALALGTTAPVLLRKEALSYRDKNGVPVFGGDKLVAPEKAIVANCAAVREWDACMRTAAAHAARVQAERPRRGRKKALLALCF